MRTSSVVGPLIVAVLLVGAGFYLRHASSVSSTRDVGLMFAAVGLLSLVGNGALFVHRALSRERSGLGR